MHQLFYKILYSSTEPIINKSHVDLFFNSNNPFITKPTKEEVVECEGYSYISGMPLFFNKYEKF
jgi:hypothetical protein